jgi:hypothetical protein
MCGLAILSVALLALAGGFLAWALWSPPPSSGGTSAKGSEEDVLLWLMLPVLFG